MKFFGLQATHALRGAYCPLIVPFREGKIDYDTYGKLIERQIAEGTHGLLVNATSGEPTMLTLQERAELVEFVIKTSAGRRPVCAGTASESFDEMLRWSIASTKQAQILFSWSRPSTRCRRSAGRCLISRASARARKDLS
jgi:dihydrodipicolinate synthase/N-acetylneuraminate lyase